MCCAYGFCEPRWQTAFFGVNSKLFARHSLKQVVHADAFNAFQETGDVFDRATAERLLRYIYSAGGSRTPDDAYKAFRGRLPTAEALLRRRGLADAAAA